MNEKSETIPFGAAIDGLMQQIGEAGKDMSETEGIKALTDNQIECGKLVSIYSVVLASKEDEIEACAYKQLARAALELSVSIERGFTVEQVMKRGMQQANDVNKARLKKAMDRGERVSVSKVALTNDGVEVEEMKKDEVPDV